MECNTAEEFLEILKKRKLYRSSANKEYRVVKVTKESIQVRDGRTKEVYEFTPYALWAAYCELDEPDRTVANLRRYVGTKAAPSAAAILYASFGRGQTQAMIHDFLSLMTKLR